MMITSYQMMLAAAVLGWMGLLVVKFTVDAVSLKNDARRVNRRKMAGCSIQCDAVAISQQEALHDFFLSTGMDSELSRPLHNWFLDSLFLYMDIAGNARYDYCRFTGIGCDQDGYVTDISLVSKGLSGSLPESIGQLSRLEDFTLFNNSLQGSIPSSVDQWTGLRELNLGQNEFMGNFPDISNSHSLVSLIADRNAFLGTIPESLCNLADLTVLNLGYNTRMWGSIPSCLGELSNLKWIRFTNIGLVGSIPAGLCAEREMNGFKPNTFGCDAVGCASGTFQPANGRLISASNVCIACDVPSNVLASTSCNWVLLPGDLTPYPAPTYPTSSRAPTSSVPLQQTTAIPSPVPPTSSVPSLQVTSSPSPLPPYLSDLPSFPPTLKAVTTSALPTPSLRPTFGRGIPSEQPSLRPRLMLTTGPSHAPKTVVASSNGNEQANAAFRWDIMAGVIAFVAGFSLVLASMAWRKYTHDVVHKEDESEDGPVVVVNHDSSVVVSSIGEGDIVVNDVNFSSNEPPTSDPNTSLPRGSTNDDSPTQKVWDNFLVPTTKRTTSILKPTNPARLSYLPVVEAGRRVRFELPDAVDWSSESDSESEISKRPIHADAETWVSWIMNPELCSSGLCASNRDLETDFPSVEYCDEDARAYSSLKQPRRQRTQETTSSLSSCLDKDSEQLGCPSPFRVSNCASDPSDAENNRDWLDSDADLTVEVGMTPDEISSRITDQRGQREKIAMVPVYGNRRARRQVLGSLQAKNDDVDPDSIVSDDDCNRLGARDVTDATLQVSVAHAPTTGSGGNPRPTANGDGKATQFLDTFEGTLGMGEI